MRAIASILRGSANGIDRFRAYSRGVSARVLPCNARNQTSSIITRPSECNGELWHAVASRYRIDTRWRAG